MPYSLLKLSFFLLTTTSFAFGIEWEPHFSKIPTVISGTLKPFVLAVDGQTVKEDAKGVSELRLNQNAAPAPSAPQAPFFFQTDEDRLSFSDGNSSQRNLITLSLPFVASGSIEGERLKLVISGSVRDAKWDGKPVSVAEHRAEIPFSKEASSLSSTHTLELKGDPGQPGRLYNVTFSRKEPPPVYQRDYFAGYRIAAFDIDYSAMYQGFFGIGWESGLATEFFVETATPVADVVPRFAIGGLVSYQILRQHTGKNDAVWLEVGLNIRYVFVTINQDDLRYSQGPNSWIRRAESGASVGIFLRTEPVRWGPFGLGLSFIGDAYRTYPNGDTELFLDLNWHF